MNKPFIKNFFPGEEVIEKNINFDLPFIISQIISIIANQTGKNYLEVVGLNIGLLVLAKLVLNLLGVLKNKNKN